MIPAGIMPGTPQGLPTFYSVAVGELFWEIPQYGTWAQVIVIGSGSGGGSGRKSVAGVVAFGGASGGSAAMCKRWVNLAELRAQFGTRVPVFVAPGGLGGLAQATASTDGNPGANGASSTFGDPAKGIYILAGAGTAGGAATTAAATAGGAPTVGDYLGGAGVAGTNSVGTIGVANTAGQAPCSGAGSGAGLVAAHAAQAGGGSGFRYGALGPSGGASSTRGFNGITTGSDACSAGATGGGSSITGNGGDGGDGCIGGGGAGGGAAEDGVGNSGKGGNGGDGAVYIMVWL